MAVHASSRNGLRTPFSCPPISVAVILVVLMCTANPAASEVPRLDMLKAAFLMNFAKFTTWPLEKAPREAVHFCIEDGAIDPRALDDWKAESLQGAKVRSRFITERSPAAIAGCHVLLLGTAIGSPHDSDLRELARANHILLVSAAEGFAEAGGHIGLFIVDNRLKFNINLEAVRRAELSLSSQLLRLAEIIGS